MQENWAVVNLEQLKSSRMQDMHGTGEEIGGGGRFIGAGDRRMRPHNHQVVNCPRCDSLNTKFCYYNNYNLSQPRHFCKSCRRYWTKGGVLRNVPVGGGSRKTKRSKPKTNASSSSAAADEDAEEKSTAQSSSSESSSLTTSAAAVATATATAPPTSSAAAEPIHTTPDSAVMYNFADASFSNVNPIANPSLDQQPPPPSSAEQIFAAEVETFTGMMTSQEELMMGFDIATATATAPEEKAEGLKMEDIGNEALDWGSGGDGGDQGLFDLTAGVDPGYWSQSDWTDNDQSLNYLP